MCLRRAPEKYIAGAKVPAGAAFDRAGLEAVWAVESVGKTWKGQNFTPTGIELRLSYRFVWLKK
jgi:hypothetical protein